MPHPLRIRRLDLFGFALLAAVSLAALAAFARIDNATVPERDDPVIHYGVGGSHDPIAELNRRLASGQVALQFEPRSGYLRSVLEALNVPVESQLALFSKTGLQANITNPHNPRTLFFGDSVVIGWVHGGVVEAAAEDPQQGVTFYTLAQLPAAKPRFMPGSGCLACHDSNDAGGVPGMLVRSAFTGADGSSLAQFGTTVVDHRTPFDRRWGGWYVTGSSGGMRHRGNSMVANPALEKPDAAITPATLHVASLESRFDTATYLSPYSDIAALMVFEHQMHVINLFTRLNWQARYAAAQAAGAGAASAGQPSDEATAAETAAAPAGTPPGAIPRAARADLQESANELADYLLFADEAPLTAKIESSSGFARKFSAEGPFDSQGRSLRQLDLQHRLMRYPCSYMIYSPAFDALPADARNAVYRRMWNVLSGREKSSRFRRLSLADRQAVVEILRDTKPTLPRYFQTAAIR